MALRHAGGRSTCGITGALSDCQHLGAAILLAEYKQSYMEMIAG
jgi:hypothetical protein